MKKVPQRGDKSVNQKTTRNKEMLSAGRAGVVLNNPHAAHLSVSVTDIVRRLRSGHGSQSYPENGRAPRQDESGPTGGKCRFFHTIGLKIDMFSLGGVRR